MSDEPKDFILKDQEDPGDTSEEKKRAGAKKDYTEASQSEGTTQLPEINFPTFIISLNASALMHLGALEDPNTGEKTKNLPMAKQTIDILSMLEDKTKGNLSEEEDKILKNVLYDLRIIYVKESK